MNTSCGGPAIADALMNTTPPFGEVGSLIIGFPHVLCHCFWVTGTEKGVQTGIVFSSRLVASGKTSLHFGKNGDFGWPACEDQLYCNTKDNSYAQKLCTCEEELQDGCFQNNSTYTLVSSGEQLIGCTSSRNRGIFFFPATGKPTFPRPVCRSMDSKSQQLLHLHLHRHGQEQVDKRHRQVPTAARGFA